jgi:hypothetical protein
VRGHLRARVTVGVGERVRREVRVMGRGRSGRSGGCGRDTLVVVVFRLLCQTTVVQAVRMMVVVVGVVV